MTMRVVSGLLFVLFSCIVFQDVATAWTVSPHSIRNSSSCRSCGFKKSMAASNNGDDAIDQMDPSKMRVLEIKTELQQRRVDFSDCFDKESLVAKLLRARDGLEPVQSDDDPDPPSAADSTTSNAPPDTPSNNNNNNNNNNNDNDNDTAADISTMRLSEIKTELKSRRIDFRDCFDKEGLVDRLTQARAGLVQPMPEPVEPPPSWAGSSEHYEYGAESSATPGEGDADEDMDAAFAAAGWTGQSDEPSVNDQQRSPGMKRNFSKINNMDFKKPYNFDK